MLIDFTTCLQTNIICTHQNTHSLTTLNPLSLKPFSSLLLDFPELKCLFSDTPVKHDIVHHIETSGPPVSSHTRHLPPERLAIAN